MTTLATVCWQCGGQILHDCPADADYRLPVAPDSLVARIGEVLMRPAAYPLPEPVAEVLSECHARIEQLQRERDEALDIAKRDSDASDEWCAQLKAAESRLARITQALGMGRDQAQLMAGEMTAGEWRTVKAILDAIRHTTEG